MGKIENMKNWVKDHKKEIAIGVGTVVVGGVMIVVGHKTIKNWDKLSKGAKDVTNSITKNNWVKVDLLEATGGMIEEISGPADKAWKDVWLGKVPLTKLGELGEKLMEIGYSAEDFIEGGVNSIVKVDFVE